MTMTREKIRSTARRLAVYMLVPIAILWTWPRMIMRDLSAGYRKGRE